MVKLSRIAEVLKLIEEVEEVADRLLPNEREMLAHLKAKYREPGQDDFDDAICLEVMRRNVAVRAGYNWDPERDGGRLIGLLRQ